MSNRSSPPVVKPGIAHELPADLLNYQRKHLKCPHPSTLDQFFDEAQWESYRKLGELISHRLFAEYKGDKWSPRRMEQFPLAQLESQETLAKQASA